MHRVPPKPDIFIRLPRACRLPCATRLLPGYFYAVLTHGVAVFWWLIRSWRNGGKGFVVLIRPPTVATGLSARDRNLLQANIFREVMTVSVVRFG